MQTVAIVFVAILVAGYLLTAGAVIGAGVLSPAFGARRTGTAIGALFLGSEVWLVAIIGLFAGIFPAFEASILATGYPLVAAFLLCWIARDAALWFGPRISHQSWQGFWGVVLGVASTIMAICFGGIFGLALSGGGDAGHGATFDVARLGSPAVWIGAIVLPIIFAAHGRAFLASREGRGSSGLGWISSVVVMALGVWAALFGSSSLVHVMADERSAQLIASIAIPGVILVFVVQAMWWWLVTRRAAAPTVFFSWNTA